MSTPVSDVLLDPAYRPHAVATLTEVIDEEVAAKRGFAGGAVRAAYAAVRVLDPDLVTRATDQMLPDFARALDGLWATRSEADFGAHLVAHSDEATDALLAVTDARARESQHASLAAIYGTLRGRAREHVAAALPRLGAAVESLLSH